MYMGYVGEEASKEFLPGWRIGSYSDIKGCMTWLITGKLPARPSKVIAAFAKEYKNLVTSSKMHQVVHPYYGPNHSLYRVVDVVSKEGVHNQLLISISSAGWKAKLSTASDGTDHDKYKRLVLEWYFIAVTVLAKRMKLSMAKWLGEKAGVIGISMEFSKLSQCDNTLKRMWIESRYIGKKPVVSAVVDSCPKCESTTFTKEVVAETKKGTAYKNVCGCGCSWVPGTKHTL